MGFIVLFAVGALLAWLAPILLRQDDARSIALFLIVAEVGALVFGGLASGESLLVGVSATALLAGSVGAIALLAALAFTRMRLVR